MVKKGYNDVQMQGVNLLALYMLMVDFVSVDD
jgi:hypothetical protein